MAAPKKSWVVELFWKIHPRLYRWTGGALGGRVQGMPVLLLTMRGRKSGQPRIRALTYLPRGDAFVVIASYLGEPRHPDWWLNLVVEPNAEVQVGSSRRPVCARAAEGTERDGLWGEIVAAMPDYAEYQQRTGRRIPVVVLEPRLG